jgi:hypothetical protein
MFEDTTELKSQLAAIDWQQMASQIADNGFALTHTLVQPQTCQSLCEFYSQNQRFRSTINMNRYQYGSGEYKYFSYPLEPFIQTMREYIYGHLVPIANHWSKLINLGIVWPEKLNEFLNTNAAVVQLRPTPLMLRYQQGDYNCLHQDKYSEHYFPFQALILLSVPGQDFEGEEFTLVENRPRQQSRASVVPLQQGQLLIFPNQFGLKKSIKGFSRTQIRHGVSTILSW